MNTCRHSRRLSGILAFILLLTFVLSYCRVSAEEADVPSGLPAELSLEQSSVLPGLFDALSRLKQSFPDAGEEAASACRLFLNTLTELRAQAFFLGAQSEDEFCYPGFFSAEACYEDSSVLEDIISDLDAYGAQSGRLCRVMLLRVTYYLNRLLDEETDFLSFYFLGRTGSPDPEEFTLYASCSISVYPERSVKSEPCDEIEIGEPLSFVSLSREKNGAYWGELSDESGWLILTEDSLTEEPVNKGAVLAEAICAAARSEINAVSDPYLTGHNKFNSWFGDSGSPWCAYFVVYNAIQAGVPDSVIPHTSRTRDGVSYCVGGCAALRNYMLKYCGAVWHDFDSDYIPQAGDIVYYGRTSSLSGISHVGLVLEADSEYSEKLSSGRSSFILTAEGNTSWEEHTSNCVMEKQRAMDADGKVGTGFYVLGYLTPAYDESQ